MKLTITNTGWLLFAAALIYILFLRECKHSVMLLSPRACRRANHDNYHDSTIIKHDTTTHVLYKPHSDTEIVFKHDTIYKTLTLAQLDTVAAHYYTGYIITRQFADSILKATMVDSISRNNIIGQKFTYVLKKPFISIYRVPEKKLHNKVYLGGQIALYPFSYIGLTATATLITRQEHSYTIGYDVINKAATVGMAWKVRW